MSHIPNSAMKHAGPTHHEEKAKPAKPAPRPGISGSLIALGGTLLVGAVAAVAVPLWRRRADADATPARKPRKAAAAKGNGKGAAKHAGAKTAKAEAGAKTNGHKPAAHKQADA